MPRLQSDGIRCCADNLLGGGDWIDLNLTPLLESLDEFTGTFFVGAPEVSTLPLLLYSASMEGNYQISSITALILLVPSIGFMLLINRFMRPEVLSKLGQ